MGSITLRFYDVDKHHDSDPLEDVLRKIFKKPMKDREQVLTNGTAIRLEHLEEEDGVFYGDLTRIQ